jgi:hypothetical protein
VEVELFGVWSWEGGRVCVCAMHYCKAWAEDIVLTRGVAEQSGGRCILVGWEEG